MAVQNAIYTPNRVTKKKYFYDPSLEKGILNSVTTLGRDSSMDNENYKDVCFCPVNNKLYAVRTNSSSNAGNVDVICPNSTTQTQSPYATISVANYANVILYCPSVKRIFAMAPSKISIIETHNNTVESEISMSSSWSPACAAYNPATNKIYVGSLTGAIITVIDPGKVSNSGILTGAKEEFEIKSVLETVGYTQVTGIKIDPDRNTLYLFDGSVQKGSTPGVQSNYIDIQMDKNGNFSYSHENNLYDWVESNQYTKDVIHCPFDNVSYWLASSGDLSTQESKVFKINMYDQVSPRTINLDKDYKKLVYCPDNNMIYVLGDNNIQMIDPANTNGARPVPEFFDSDLSIYTDGVCYSTVNNRIYGVGKNGYIEYIDPTT